MFFLEYFYMLFGYEETYNISGIIFIKKSKIPGINNVFPVAKDYLLKPMMKLSIFTATKLFRITDYGFMILALNHQPEISNVLSFSKSKFRDLLSFYLDFRGVYGTRSNVHEGAFLRN